MSENRKDIYYNEGALRILEALSAVDEDLLERCKEAPEPVESTGKTAKILNFKKRRKPLWKMGRTWAACLGLLAVGFISWNGLRLATSHGLSFDSAGNSTGGGLNQSQSTTEETSPEDSEGVYSGNTDIADNARGEAPSGETAGYTEAEVNGGSGSDSGSTLDSDEVINRESPNETDQEPYKEDIQKEVGSSVSDTSATKPVTEEEARNWMPLGAYIPQNLPEGYHVENAYINPEEQSVTMIWTRGMDNIMVSVSNVAPGTMETVDITKPETYDERLYEIPYAETVPEEYWESMNNPVFDFSDMDYDNGLELMNSRMISYDDAGDTNTPRGHFTILIEDKILLYFNGRGTPEEIWNMFYSMKR